MKAYILTFHYANNYGALLQCYALSKKLLEYGVQVELLNLNPSNHNESIRSRIRKLFYNARLNKFRNNYLPRQSKCFSTTEELIYNTPVADIYIVGSDQVWNPQITGQNWEAYYLNFTPSSAKRISYAASFGISEWSDSSKLESINKLLSKFDAVSVREYSGLDICKESFKIDAKKVLDPTFLIDDYSSLYNNSKRIKKKSIITYKFSKNQSWYKLLRHLSKDTGLQVVSLNDNKLHKGVKSSPYTSVETWLANIKDAEYVLTDSFHCMVFAIIFKVPFVVFPAHPQRVGRILSLLQDLGLEDRFYNDYNDLYNNQDWLNPINFDSVHEKLQHLREDSLKYLSNCLFA